jgi:hypothetical protein
MYIYPFISRNLKRVTTAELPEEVSNWVFYKLARSLARRRFDLRLPKGVQENGVIVRQDVGKLGPAQRKIALCDSEGLFRLLLKKIDAEKQDDPSAHTVQCQFFNVLTATHFKVRLKVIWVPWPALGNALPTMRGPRYPAKVGFLYLHYLSLTPIAGNGGGMR